jgi:hypothetical protein
MRRTNVRRTGAQAAGPRRSTLDRLSDMEAFFISLMAAVVVLTGWVSVVVLYKLFKADNS